MLRQQQPSAPFALQHRRPPPASAGGPAVDLARPVEVIYAHRVVLIALTQCKAEIVYRSSLMSENVRRNASSTADFPR